MRLPAQAFQSPTHAFFQPPCWLASLDWQPELEPAWDQRSRQALTALVGDPTGKGQPGNAQGANQTVRQVARLVRAANLGDAKCQRS